MKENALINYFKDSVKELNKVTWPTKNQAVKLTFLVLGFIFASALFLGVFDYLFNFGYKNLLGLRPFTNQTQNLEVQPTDGSNQIDVGDIQVLDENGNPVDSSGLQFDVTQGQEQTTDGNSTEQAPAN